MDQLQDLDIVMTNIVILIGPREQEAAPLNQERLNQILHPPLSIGQTIDGGLVISSPRDQIEVILVQNQLNVRDISGKTPSERPLTSKVVSELFLSINSPITAYGLNYELTFKSANGVTPSNWIASTFGNVKNIQKHTNLQVDYRAVTLQVHHESKLWNLSIGAASEERIRVELNAHASTSAFPSEKELVQEFADEYKKLLPFVESLNSRVR